MKTVIDEISELAIRLNAVGRWMEDRVSIETETGKLMLDSAKWLKKLSNNICAGGIIGCRGGRDCTSDHK